MLNVVVRAHAVRRPVVLEQDLGRAPPRHELLGTREHVARRVLLLDESSEQRRGRAGGVAARGTKRRRGTLCHRWRGRAATHRTRRTRWRRLVARSAKVGKALQRSSRQGRALEQLPGGSAALATRYPGNRARELFLFGFAAAPAQTVTLSS